MSTPLQKLTIAENYTKTGIYWRKGGAFDQKAKTTFLSFMIDIQGRTNTEMPTHF